MTAYQQDLNPAPLTAKSVSAVGECTVNRRRHEIAGGIRRMPELRRGIVVL